MNQWPAKIHECRFAELNGIAVRPAIQMPLLKHPFRMVLFFQWLFDPPTLRVQIASGLLLFTVKISQGVSKMQKYIAGYG